MVRGMLETGYYHVPFELISQTKWSQALTTTPPPSLALARVNPAPVVAPRSPTRSCFSSALGSKHFAFCFFPSLFQAGRGALRRITCLFRESGPLQSNYLLLVALTLRSFDVLRQNPTTSRLQLPLLGTQTVTLQFVCVPCET